MSEDVGGYSVTKYTSEEAYVTSDIELYNPKKPAMNNKHEKHGLEEVREAYVTSGIELYNPTKPAMK